MLFMYKLENYIAILSAHIYVIIMYVITKVIMAVMMHIVRA